MNKLIAIILLSGFFIGCEFSEVNIDDNQISSVELAELLPVAETQAAFNTGALLARSSGMLMQHWDQQNMSVIIFPQYGITNETFNNYWNNAAYGGVLSTCNSIIELANDEEELPFEAVAKILTARELGTLTSSFGDVPFSQAFDVTLLKVPYDTQEEIYISIQILLDEAIGTLEQSNSSLLEGDLIYEGDLSQWIQAAHALKARYYMHISRRDPNASQKAIDEINLAFADNSGQPDFIFGSGLVAANPLAKYAQERPFSMSIHNNLSERMSSNSDPRVSAYMYDNGQELTYYNPDSNSSLFWTRNNSPIPLISFTEIKFIEAEALLRTGDFVNAEVSMKEAVVSNMEYLGIDNLTSEEYLTAHVNFDGLITDEEKLQKVIEQKYISLYFQGVIEIWVDYRRTGYPTLSPNPYGENELNPGGQIPQRLVYVSREYLTNKQNVEYAATNIGGDLLSTKLWAFK